MRALLIDGRRIADDEPAWVCAELGHNHGGDRATALKMIRVAADCGVSACKLQKRENATLYTPDVLSQPYENENSYGRTYGEHRAALELSESDYRACQGAAHLAAVTLFATAFDEPSADFLMGLSMPAIKLASGSLTDHALLGYVSSLGVPLILSTGGGTVKDIDTAVQILSAKTTAFALLHATAAYPVRCYPEHNLSCLSTLRARYPETVIGWSAHDSGIALAMVAYTLGARIFEFHFTLNRANKGTDHAFSLEPSGLMKLCRDLDRARQAMGDGVKRVYDSERKPLAKMRRTLQEDGTWKIGR